MVLDIVISIMSAIFFGCILAVISGVGLDYHGYYNNDQSDKRKDK